MSCITLATEGDISTRTADMARPITNRIQVAEMYRISNLVIVYFAFRISHLCGA